MTTSDQPNIVMTKLDTSPAHNALCDSSYIPEPKHQAAGLDGLDGSFLSINTINKVTQYLKNLVFANHLYDFSKDHV